MDAKRDWGYAKEYCEMFWKILQHKNPDDFVIATNETYSVRDFVSLTCKELGINFKWSGNGVNEKAINKKNNKTFIKISPRYYRKGEVNYLLGDSNKALKILKWKPKVNLSSLVKIMVKEELNLLQNKRFY